MVIFKAPEEVNKSDHSRCEGEEVNQATKSSAQGTDQWKNFKSHSNPLFRLATRAPGGGAGGDGVAGEVGLAFGAGAAFFPAMLEEPVFGRDL